MRSPLFQSSGTNNGFNLQKYRFPFNIKLLNAKTITPRNDGLSFAECVKVKVDVICWECLIWIPAPNKGLD